MGYYTYFSGSIHSSTDSQENIETSVARAIARLEYFESDYIDEEDIQTIDDVISGDEMKWYSWQADMQEVSKQFPNTVICTEGEGEDHDDTWRAYFKNGKCALYHAIITFPELNYDDLH